MNTILIVSAFDLGHNLGCVLNQSCVHIPFMIHTTLLLPQSRKAIAQIWLIIMEQSKCLLMVQGSWPY